MSKQGGLEATVQSERSDPPPSKPQSLLLQEEVREILVHHRLREGEAALVEAIQLSVNRVASTIVLDICKYKKRNLYLSRLTIAKRDVALAIAALAKDESCPARRFYEYILTMGNMENTLGKEPETRLKDKPATQRQKKQRTEEVIPGISNSAAKPFKYGNCQINHRFLQPTSQISKAFLEGYRLYDGSGSPNPRNPKRARCLLGL